jgi:hypothetical protein
MDKIKATISRLNALYKEASTHKPSAQAGQKRRKVDGAADFDSIKLYLAIKYDILLLKNTIIGLGQSERFDSGINKEFTL